MPDTRRDPPEDLTDDRKARLDRLYGLREDFKIGADSDGEWAKYAEEALRVLEEAGYDIDTSEGDTDD